MSFDPISALFDLGKNAIDKIWPDPIKRAEELRKLEEMKQAGRLEEMSMHVKLMLAQIDVNKTEAQHKSIFVAGWRPFIGWVGGVSLAYAGLIYPLLSWFWAFAQVKGWIPQDLEQPPLIEASNLGAIVTGMLGIGGMRSFDKKQQTQTDAIR